LSASRGVCGRPRLRPAATADFPAHHAARDRSQFTVCRKVDDALLPLCRTVAEYVELLRAGHSAKSSEALRSLRDSVRQPDRPIEGGAQVTSVSPEQSSPRRKCASSCGNHVHPLVPAPRRRPPILRCAGALWLCPRSRAGPVTSRGFRSRTRPGAGHDPASNEIDRLPTLRIPLWIEISVLERAPTPNEGKHSLPRSSSPASHIWTIPKRGDPILTNSFWRLRRSPSLSHSSCAQIQ
jgi:hypothetical protein